MRIPMSTRSRAVAPPLLALLLLLTLCGCFGGAEVRDPQSAVAVERSHWLFPLYHYQENQGRRVLRPFFLIPIPLGGVTEYSSADDSLSEDRATRLGGTDVPAWGSSEGAAGSGGVARAEQPTDIVEPGVWGSSQPRSEATLGLSDSGREHEVRAGETLYAISRQYYGSGAEWTRIAEANRDRIGNPASLGIGVRLRIP